MNEIKMLNVLPHVFDTLDDLSSDVWRSELKIEKGKTYLLKAESGKGKSTFCSYLLGYRNDYSGNILFDNSDVSAFSIKKWTDIRKHHISHLFQELRLFPELTAMENVEIKNSLTGSASVREIENWFERLGIADKRDEKIGKMSFGQQQRVALMRCLVQPFDFLMVDEPISHLDDANANVMSDIIMENVRKNNAGLIVTSIGRHPNIEYDKILRL